VNGWPEGARLREIRARARAAAAVLRLPLGRQVWSGPAGAWTGPGRGASLEFQDHREYAPGDDPRHIDWQAYARSDAYTMKMYREEVSPSTDLLLDASASMFLDPQKRDRALELFCFAAESAAAAGAAVRTYALNGAGWQALDPTLAVAPRLPPEGPARAPALPGLPLRPGGLRVLVSDCLFPEPPEALLRTLVGPRSRGLVLAPFAAAEVEPRWEREMEMVDCETGKHRQQRVDGPLLARYAASYRRHFEGWREACARRRVAFARLSSADALADVLRREALPAGAVEPGR
jgi:uncharacterized protein (DUF58 family)